MNRKEISAFNNSIYVNRRLSGIIKGLAGQYQLYAMILLPIAYIFIFHYIPIYGIQIAFKDFNPTQGILHSPWVGFKYFRDFVNSYQFARVIRNTLEISIYSMVAGFPIPVILALALNNSLRSGFKKVVQMVSYAPYFISTVVLVGIVMQILSPKFGVANQLLEMLGKEPVGFLSEPGLFSTIYVWSGIWQHAGWGSIIYIAALSSVDPTLYEAAIVDGAGIFKRMVHIDLPSILPTIIIMFILNMGHLLNIGFEKNFLMQNPLNLSRSEIISTYVYKVGLTSGLPNYSYASAIGLFNNLINFVLILTVNKVAQKLTETSLW